MPHLIARHPLPHINIALVIAIVWIALAVAATVYDIGRMVQAWCGGRAVSVEAWSGAHRPE